VEAPDQPDRDDEAEPAAPEPGNQASEPAGETPVGVDVATIGLLVFFIALIGIVAALLLLAILAG